MIYIDEQLVIHAPEAGTSIPLEEALEKLATRVNPGGSAESDASERKKQVDDLRIKAMDAANAMLLYGTLLYGPDDELAIRERAVSHPLANDRHHRVAGVDFDLRNREPPPLRCMAWFVQGPQEESEASGMKEVFACVTEHISSRLDRDKVSTL